MGESEAERAREEEEEEVVLLTAYKRGNLLVQIFCPCRNFVHAPDTIQA